MNYSNLVIFYRRAKELFGDAKQETIVRETGISQGTISRIMNGKGAPQADTLVKIAMYYRVNINWLLGIPGAKRDIAEETPDTRVECDAYGLSDQAIRTLRELKGSKIATGLDSLLSSYCFEEDRGDSKSLLEAVANYCADIWAIGDSEDIYACLAKDGSLSIGETKLQTSLPYGERRFSVSDVILEAEIQDIQFILRYMKNHKMRKKIWNSKGIKNETHS